MRRFLSNIHWGR